MNAAGNERAAPDPSRLPCARAITQYPVPPIRDLIRHHEDMLVAALPAGSAPLATRNDKSLLLILL